MAVTRRVMPTVILSFLTTCTPQLGSFGKNDHKYTSKYFFRITKDGHGQRRRDLWRFL